VLIIAQEATEVEVLPAGVEFAPAGVEFAPAAFENLSAHESDEARYLRVLTEASVSTRLTAEQRDIAMGVIMRHCSTFRLNPGLTTLAELEINTGRHLPVARRAYRNPLIANAGFLKQLEEWETEGIIRRSKSAWAAPVLLVPKKDGTCRTVIDYRGLNKLLTKESNPVQLISDMLDSMGGSAYFTTLDLTSG